MNVLRVLVLLLLAPMAVAQSPLRVEITQGVIEPMPIAVPSFVAESGGGEWSEKILQVVLSDLIGSGLFRAIPRDAHISGVNAFNDQIKFADWKAVNAQALVIGAVGANGNNLTVKFRLFDTFAQTQMGKGLQFAGTTGSWRRLAHKVADAVYQRLTGEGPYFDSRVAFIHEEGPKNKRLKRLAVMDYDGANMRFLTGDQDIVLAPRFSPNARELIYTSYERGVPRVFLMNADTGAKRALDEQPGMSFAPRFSPDGRDVVLSLTNGANTDIYRVNLASGVRTRLTSEGSIETAPSFSPDGSRIVFESDRGGSQQIYVMPSGGGAAERISFGKGSYGTPVWSPRGDLIAFTKILGGAFHIGVMATDGSGERLLTKSFLDEGPTWSPNGRVIMFFRESAGANGAPALYSVDLTGRNLKLVPTQNFASDPAWSQVLP